MIRTSLLTSNYQISRIIKGGWQLAGGHGPIHKGQAIEDMFQFVDVSSTSFSYH